MAKVNQIKGFLGIVLLNLYTLSGQAQYSDTRIFTAGFVLGMNFSQVDGDNFAGYHKGSLNAGIITFARTSDQTAFSMELLLSQKGSRAGVNQVPRRANDQNTILTDYKIKLNYLEIPILFNLFDKKRNHIEGGLSYGRLVGSKETYRNENGFVYENDAKLFPFRKSDFMYTLGGTARVWKNFFVNIRFSYSLVSIRNQYNFITGRPQQFNNMWTTRIVYMLSKEED